MFVSYVYFYGAEFAQHSSAIVFIFHYKIYPDLITKLIIEHKEMLLFHLKLSGKTTDGSRRINIVFNQVITNK